MVTVNSLIGGFHFIIVRNGSIFGTGPLLKIGLIFKKKDLTWNWLQKHAPEHMVVLSQKVYTINLYETNPVWIFTFDFITSRPSQSAKSNCRDLKKHSYTCTYKCIHIHTLKQNHRHTHTHTHRWPQSLPYCQYNYCTQLFWWIFHYVCISCLAGAFRGSDSKFRWDTHN